MKKDNIKFDEWLEKFDEIINACETPILDLGCGSGNDTLYLLNKGKKVISCDQSENAIKNIKKNFPEVFDAKCFNMLDGFPFPDNYCDLIVATQLIIMVNIINYLIVYFRLLKFYS